MYENEQDNEPISIRSENISFGEKALNSVELRAETAIAHKLTVCLCLAKTEFDEKVFYLEHQKKLNRLEYLIKMPLTQGWTEQRCRDLNSLMTQVDLGIGEVVYSVGDNPDYFYILLKGALSMHTVVELQDANKYPVGKNHWESLSTEK